MILLFLGASPEAHEAELEAWARARLVELREPLSDATAGLEYPADVAARVEQDLEAARLGFATLDEASARKRLADAEQLLRDHPALPQAAWLMAERLEIEAEASSRSGDVARASELRRRAILLEGPRAPSFAPGASPAPAPAVQTRTIVVHGLAAGDRVYWNGVAGGRRVRAGSGEHHVRVVRGGRAVWAGWVTVAAGASTLTLGVPPTAPCSRDELARTRIAGDRVIPSPTTRCESWAVARPSSLGGIEVATCHAARCGPLLAWQKSYGAIYEGPPQPKREAAGLPTWATLTLLGVGAAVVGGVVAWRAGAFDEPEPAGSHWRFYGP